MMHEGHHHHHDHDHEHTHEHSHAHTHSHAPAEGASEPVKRAFTLMNYMYSHNSDHTEELAEMAGKLRGLGEDAAADMIDEAVKAYREGNAKLHDALHLIKG